MRAHQTSFIHFRKVLGTHAEISKEEVYNYEKEFFYVFSYFHGMIARAEVRARQISVFLFGFT